MRRYVRPTGGAAAVGHRRFGDQCVWRLGEQEELGRLRHDERRWLIVLVEWGQVCRRTVQMVMGTFPDSLDPQRGYSTQAAEADWISYTGLVTYKHTSGIAGATLIPGSPPRCRWSPTVARLTPSRSARG